MQITIELKDKEVTRMSSMRAERVGAQESPLIKYQVLVQLAVWAQHY